MKATPNLDALKSELRRLVAAGCPPAFMEDRFIGSSEASAQLFQRALAEFSAVPRTVMEGKVEVSSGVGSLGARRSVAGFREMLREAVAS